MKKIFLTGFAATISLISNAQSATSAGNDAFADAMIRNVLIIVGVAVVYFLFKSSSKKNDKKD